MTRPLAPGPALLPALLPVLLSVLLGACTAAEPPPPQTEPTPSATPTQAAATPPPRPDDGDCYDLGFAEAVSPTSTADPVPCEQRHTAQTFRVDRLDLTVGGHLLAVDSDRAQAQAAATCRDSLAGHLGATEEARRLSMLDAVWFTPTVEDAAEGAAWVRCDVVAVSAGQDLAPLPASTAGLLATEAGRDDYGMCGTAEPGTESFRRVLCSESHTWRAVASVELPGTTYPSAEEAASVMQEECRDAARARAEDPLDFTWSEERPTEEQWEAGRRYGLCWVPTEAA